MRKILFVLTIVTAMVVSAKAQISGCTDQKANNYNSAATINDGSCSYNITLYNPPLKFLLPDMIEETSGLAYVNGKFWTINDSGGEPILYAFDTATGIVSQQITVEGAINVDWESMANDNDYIYIGDFGNNSGMRDDLTIYRVAISEIPYSGNGSVASSKTTFSFSDYKRPAKRARDHNFDCEAFIATDNNLFLFSKNWGDAQTKLYRLPKEPGDYIAEYLTKFNSAGLITGADIDNVNNEITLVGYVSQSWIPFAWLLFDYEGEDFFSGNKRRIDMLNLTTTQTEAIAYTQGRYASITSEGTQLFSQTAFNFDAGLWTAPGPSDLPSESGEVFDFQISPNPTKANKIVLKVNNLPVGEYQIEVYDTLGNMVKADSYKVSRKGSEHKIKIKINSLRSGTYFVRMRGGLTTVEKKFIVL